MYLSSSLTFPQHPFLLHRSSLPPLSSWVTLSLYLFHSSNTILLVNFPHFSSTSLYFCFLPPLFPLHLHPPFCYDLCFPPAPCPPFPSSLTFPTSSFHSSPPIFSFVLPVSPLFITISRVLPRLTVLGLHFLHPQFICLHRRPRLSARYPPSSFTFVTPTHTPSSSFPSPAYPFTMTTRELLCR